MATELTMTGSKKLKTLAKEFSQKFNYLSLVFKKANNHAIDDSKSLAEVREKKGGELSIVGNLTVGKLEERFMEYYGLNVQVVYKTADGKIWATKGVADTRTLSQQNEAAKAEGCLSFI
jgi:hypothetical protein